MNLYSRVMYLYNCGIILRELILEGKTQKLVSWKIS